LGLDLDYRAFLELAALPMSYRGDLWGDGYADFPPDMFARRAVPPAIARIHANPVVVLKERLGLTNEAGLHVGSHVVFRHKQAQRRERLVLFGTSFSDYRLECSLLTFLAALFFREVHFVWSTDLDLDFIARLRPDIALLEMPERFLTFCPADRFDLAAHAGRLVAGWRG
jgi:alginate O-acetyltransferase complex protein AlgJ